MNKIFICHTEYHVLIAMLKTLKNKDEKNEIVLYGTISEVDKLCKKLLKNNIFEKVYIFNYIDIDEYKKIPKGNNIFDRIIKNKKFINNNYNFGFLKEKNNIYIFNDDSIIGRYLRLNKIRYNLIEDGLNCYQNIDKHYNFNNDFKQKIKIMFNTLDCVFGKSKYVKQIEVNSIKNINLFVKDKFIEVPRKKLFEGLTEEDKNKILNVFVEEKINFFNTKSVSILITQPLYIDGFLDNYTQQVEMYKYILNKYGVGKIVIKPHPRDEIDYSNIIEDDVIILDRNVPIEILNFIDGIIVDRVITAFSTAIDGIDFCDDKIKLGYEWVKKYRNGEINGK